MVTEFGRSEDGSTGRQRESLASSPYYGDGQPLSLLTAFAGGAMALFAEAGEGGVKAWTLQESGQHKRKRAPRGASPTTPTTPSASQPASCAHSAIRNLNDQGGLEPSPFSAFASSILGAFGLSQYPSPKDTKDVGETDGVGRYRGLCPPGKRIHLDSSPWVKSPAWSVVKDAVKAGAKLAPRKGQFVILPRSWQRRSWDAVFLLVQVAPRPT